MFENDNLSEESFVELEGLGIFREMVNAMVTGMNYQKGQLYDVAGGKELYTEMVAWADENLNRGKIKTFNASFERSWQLCGLDYYRVCVDIDTTVETLFGNQQVGRKGHNTKNRGKKGYRPVLCFIQQSREYLVGSLRKS